MLRNTFPEVGHYGPKYLEFTFKGGYLCSGIGGILWSEIKILKGGYLCPEIGGNQWSEIVTCDLPYDKCLPFLAQY